MVRNRAIALLVAAFVPAALPASASATAGRALQPLEYTIATSPVGVPGTPYHLQFTVRTSGDNWDFDFLFSRTAATGNHPTQTHNWHFTLPGADAHVDPDLSPASIHTHTDLHSFGKVDLTLHDPTDLTSHKDKCPNGTVIGSTGTRDGTLTGTFDFDANDGYFDTVHRTSFPVHLTKVVRNGKQCPDGPAMCFEGKSLVAGDQTISIFGSRPLRHGHSTITFVRTVIDAPVVIQHEITVTGPLSAFTISKGFAVKVDGGAAAPFASGIVTFIASTDPEVTTHHHCRTTVRHEAYADGSTTVTYDSGGAFTLSSGTGVAQKVRQV